MPILKTASHWKCCTWYSDLSEYLMFDLRKNRWNHCIFCTDSLTLKTYWWAHQITLRVHEPCFHLLWFVFSCSNLRKKPHWTNVFFSFSSAQTEKYWCTKLVKTEIVVRSEELIKWKMVDFKSNFYFFVSPLCYIVIHDWLIKSDSLSVCKNCFFRQKRIAIPVVQQDWWVYFLGK